MHNKVVRERLCTVAKNSPQEALQFDVAFEEGLKPQASYVECKLEIKSDPIPVCSISNPAQVCFRCGAYNFTPQQIPQCEAVKEKGEKCGIVGQFVENSRIVRVIHRNKFKCG